MEFDFWLAVVLRWIHILAAVTAAGGIVFMRLALLPAMSSLAEESRTRLHEEIRLRWSKVVMWSIALLLISGLWNFFNLNSQYSLNKVPYYHMIFGIKFILAMVVFFLSSALMGRSSAFDRLRANRKLWLTVNLALVVLIICLSGILRLSDKPQKLAQIPAASKSERRREEYSLLASSGASRLEKGNYAHSTVPIES